MDDQEPYKQINRPSRVGKFVRVHSPNGGEVWWAEHVEGDTYRSLNDALSAIPLDLPAAYDMAPMRASLPNYPGPERNGESFRVCWGHLLRCTQKGRLLTAGAVVGWDGTPLPEEGAYKR